AGELAGTLLESLHEHVSHAARAPSSIGHEIIDVEVHTDRRVLVHAPYREPADRVSLGSDDHAAAAPEYPLHLGAIVRRERGTQLAVNRFRTLEPGTRRDRAACIGDLDHIHGEWASLRSAPAGASGR